jgi:hypothetical protein
VLERWTSAAMIFFIADFTCPTVDAAALAPACGEVVRCDWISIPILPRFAEARRRGLESHLRKERDYG